MIEADAPVQATSASLLVSNADAPWDLFESQAYLQQNYSKLHELDRRIIKIVAKFFESVGDELHGAHGIDVGSGTNLYPALAMLPVTSSIEFWERSEKNVAWLRESLSSADLISGTSWQQFWDLLRASSNAYKRIDDPGAELRRRVINEPTKRDIFELPKAQWDVGTMFFVAESITELYKQFEEATRTFLNALKPGAPFVVAFMRDSKGYDVGKIKFPAVAVREREVQRALRGIATDWKLQTIFSEESFREGYEGMMLVTGRRVAGHTAETPARERPSQTGLSRPRVARPASNR